MNTEEDAEQLKEKLIKRVDKMKDLDEGILGKSAVHDIWRTARDGHTVTTKEFETLRHIVDNYEFTPAANKFLGVLATKSKSDGPGVTATEADSIRFTMAKYRLTKGAPHCLRTKL